MKNTDKLCRDFGCEGYVLLERNGKLFTYTSSNRSGWPSSITEVDQNYPLAQRYTPSSFRSKSRTVREGSESDKAISRREFAIEK